MKRSVIGRIVVGLLVIAVLAGVGVAAYQAGLMQGAAAQLNAAGADPRLLGPGMNFGWRGPLAFGLGFGLFGLLGLLFKGLLFFGLIALVARLIFRPRWHGPWGRGPWGQGEVPPMFAEWHRRAHGEAPAEPAPPAAPPAAGA